MAYDIYAIGDARFLSDILNGVAAINNSSSFGGAIAVGFVIGVLLWGFQSIASGGRTAMPGAASIFAGLILFGVSYGWRGPVSSTVLVHNVYSGETYPVDNVPLGVAVTASTVSTIGYNMARLFETAFALTPLTSHEFADPLQVLKTVRIKTLDLRLYPDLNQVAGAGGDLAGSWEMYISQCVHSEIQRGHVTVAAIASNPSLTEALRIRRGIDRVRINLTGTPEILYCDEAYTRLVTALNLVLPVIKGDVLAPALGIIGASAAARAGAFDARLNDTLIALGIDTSASELLRSSILDPMYFRAAERTYRTDLATSMAATVESAMRQRYVQWSAQESMFLSIVHPLMTVIEGFTLGFTPFLAFLMVMGFAGYAVVAQFLRLLVWIQLWYPAMAVLNYYILQAAAGRMDALHDAGGSFGSLSGLLANDSHIMHWLGVGEMLFAAIPMLTLGLIAAGTYTMNAFAQQVQGKDFVNEKQVAPDAIGQPPQIMLPPAQTVSPTGELRNQPGYANYGESSWSHSIADRLISSMDAQAGASASVDSRLGNTTSDSVTVGTSHERSRTAGTQETSGTTHGHGVNDSFSVATGTGIEKTSGGSQTSSVGENVQFSGGGRLSAGIGTGGTSAGASAGLQGSMSASGSEIASSATGTSRSSRSSDQLTLGERVDASGASEVSSRETGGSSVQARQGHGSEHSAGTSRSEQASTSSSQRYASSSSAGQERGDAIRVKYEDMADALVRTGLDDKLWAAAERQGLVPSIRQYQAATSNIADAVYGHDWRRDPGKMRHVDAVAAMKVMTSETGFSPYEPDKREAAMAAGIKLAAQAMGWGPHQFDDPGRNAGLGQAAPDHQQTMAKGEQLQAPGMSGSQVAAQFGQVRDSAGGFQAVKAGEVADGQAGTRERANAKAGEVGLSPNEQTDQLVTLDRNGLIPRSQPFYAKSWSVNEANAWVGGLIGRLQGETPSDRMQQTRRDSQEAGLTPIQAAYYAYQRGSVGHAEQPYQAELEQMRQGIFLELGAMDPRHAGERWDNVVRRLDEAAQMPEQSAEATRLIEPIAHENFTLQGLHERLH